MIYIRGSNCLAARYFWVRILPKVIFLGPNKTDTMFMLFFDTKHCLTDISGFARGNPNFYLHCFGIYVHLQVSKYK